MATTNDMDEEELLAMAIDMSLQDKVQNTDKNTARDESSAIDGKDRNVFSPKFLSPAATTSRKQQNYLTNSNPIRHQSSSLKSDGYSELHDAAAKNDTDRMTQLLQNSSEKTLLLEARDSRGQTPLHVAATHGHYRAVDLLVREGCDVNAQDDAGDTAAHISEQANCFYVSNYISEWPSWLPDVQNKAGNTAFHIATANQDQISGSMTDYLKRFSVDVINNEGYSPFHMALRNRATDLVEAFLDKKPELKSQLSVSGESPLWIAVKHNHVDVMKLLLQRGCDINCLNTELKVPVIWLALYKQEKKAINVLLKSPDLNPYMLDAPANDGISPMLLALIKGNNKQLDSLLAKIAGESIYQPSIVLARKVIFNLATKKDFELLASDGLIQSYTDKNGNSLLHLAVLSDSVEMVDAVFSRTQNYHQRNSDGLTPIELAFQRKSTHIVDFFQMRNIYHRNVLRLRTTESKLFLAGKHPMFREEVNDIFYELLKIPKEAKTLDFDDSGFITFKKLKEMVIDKVHIQWPIARRKISLSEHLKFYQIETLDKSNTKLVKYFLQILCHIETHLREHDEVFRHLDVTLVPVGSVVEGTKIGKLDELDVMFFCKELQGFLSVINEKNILISSEKLKALHPSAKQLFHRDSKTLNTTKFSSSFLDAIKEAMQTMPKEQIPKNIKFWLNRTPCQHPACQSMTTDSWCCQKPPCVCYTAVGAGLNFVYAGEDSQIIFTMDIVPTFEVNFYGASNVILRQKLIKYLMDEKPLEWGKFLKKYILKDTIYLDQYDKINEVTAVNLKMVSQNGDVVLRPCSNMNVMEMFENHVVHESYCLLKIFKHITGIMLTSFDLKKIVSRTFSRQYHSTGDTVSFLKAVLEWPDINSEMNQELKSSLTRQYWKIDLVDFPAQNNEGIGLRLISRKTVKIYRCIASGDVTIFNFLLKTIPVKMVPTLVLNGNSLLHTSCIVLMEPVVKTLMQVGSEVNLQNLNGNTPMHCALQCHLQNNQLLQRVNQVRKIDVQKSRLSILKLLLEGTRLEIQNKKLKTIFHLLPFSKAGTEIEDLLLQNASKSQLDLRDETGLTVLHLACVHENMNMVKGLMKNGADVNIIDKIGWTPLMALTKCDDIKIAKLLIKSGANLDQVDFHKHTALMRACYLGNQSLVAMLLEKKASINLRDRDGETALLLAVGRGHCAIAKHLIFLGADVNVPAANGTTPLLYACRLGDLELLKLLLERNADVNHAQNDGRVALHVACEYGHFNVVKLLVKNATNVDLPKDNTGRTPLFMACEFEKLDVVKLLLKSNANINLVRDDGTSTFPFGLY